MIKETERKRGRKKGKSRSETQRYKKQELIWERVGEMEDLTIVNEDSFNNRLVHQSTPLRFFQAIVIIMWLYLTQDSDEKIKFVQSETSRYLI